VFTSSYEGFRAKIISANFDMSRIFSFFLLCFFITTNTALAAQPISYLVENVPVSITGKSPNDARNLAVATARRDAFLILLTRLEININTADKITNGEIADMVRSEQIDGEKISGNTYSATFNIMFAKSFVDHTLSAKNAVKTDKEEKKAEITLLIPAKMTKRKTSLWEGDNDWKRAVEKSLEEKKAAKKAAKNFVIPEADLSNISIVNRDNVETIDYTTLEPILTRYGASAAYITFFSFDNIENKAVVNVFYLRKLQRKQLRLSLVNVDRISYEDLVDKVASKTLDYLATPQLPEDKNMNAGTVHIGITLSSLGNWLMIKNKIESSNLINQLNIESLSRDYALISVNYIDSRVDIVEAFAAAGIILVRRNDGFYTIN
jgi:hypothetical protein